MKRFSIVLVFAIFILAAFLRFYKLGSIPNGLERDETSIGYNAYSIMKTNKDEYGVRLPLYFKAFGEYKLPVYIYLSTIPIRLFGLTAFSVRFLSALTGTLSVVVFYFLIREILIYFKIKSKYSLSLLTTFTLAINPWHLHFSRAAFEVTPALFFTLFGLLTFFIGVRQKRFFWFFLTTFSFMISVYTYTTYRLFIPCLILTLFVLFRKNISKIPLRICISNLVIGLVLFLPVLLNLVSKSEYAASAGTVLFTSKAVAAPLLELSNYFAPLPPLILKIFFNVKLLLLWQYVVNITHYLSVDFFYVSGSTHGNHGIGTVGQFYLFELPFFIVGLFALYNQSRKFFALLVSLVVSVVLIAALTREAPQATRSFALIIPMVVITGFGVWQAYRYVITTFSKNIRKGILFGFGVIMLYFLSLYFASYYDRFPIAYATAWSSQDKELSQFVASIASRYTTVTFSQDSGFSYTSYLFYTHFSPEEFQTNVFRFPDDTEGFSAVGNFRQFGWRNIDWHKDLANPNTLLIISGHEKIPEGVSGYRIVKTIYYPTRPYITSRKEVLLATRVQEIAYEVIEPMSKR